MTEMSEHNETKGFKTERKQKENTSKPPMSNANHEIRNATKGECSEGTLRVSLNPPPDSHKTVKYLPR